MKDESFIFNAILIYFRLKNTEIALKMLFFGFLFLVSRTGQIGVGQSDCSTVRQIDQYSPAVRLSDSSATRIS